MLELRAEQEAQLSQKSLGFVTTINPTILEAGGTRNVIPSVATAGVDMRVTPGQVHSIFVVYNLSFVFQGGQHNLDREAVSARRQCDDRGSGGSEGARAVAPQ